MRGNPRTRAEPRLPVTVYIVRHVVFIQGHNLFFKCWWLKGCYLESRDRRFTRPTSTGVEAVYPPPRAISPVASRSLVSNATSSLVRTFAYLPGTSLPICRQAPWIVYQGMRELELLFPPTDLSTNSAGENHMLRDHARMRSPNPAAWPILESTEMVIIWNIKLLTAE